MPLVTMIVAAFGLAFIFGMVAKYLHLSPIVGYLLAGVVIGPVTPGYDADLHLAHQLAEIGVILLMFGVGLHFSLKDLLAFKKIAVPGAICQIVFATLMGWGLAHTIGLSFSAGILFGLSLSVASTVVLLRALDERHLLKTKQGKIAVGWLIVEDMVVIIVLMIVPAVVQLNATSGDNSLIYKVVITLFKMIAFFVLMLVVGTRIIPWILKITEKTKSIELFRLSVLAIALGVAYGAANLFDVSFALGAFFAGMILSESELSQKAAEETLPLRDAFAVLFFVAMGMIFNPMILISQPLFVLATVAIIVLGKSITAYLLVLAFRYPNYVALTVAVSLAQIGEFSFILTNLGVKLKILTHEIQDVIIAGAIISILLSPLLFSILIRFKPKQSALDKKI